MANLIKKTISISATPHAVWRVFTDPVVTKQMGGHYVSTWKAGDSLQWKGEDGQMSTFGIILAIEPERLLKHSLYDLKTKSRITSVITYQIEKKETYTLLHAEEELSFDMREEQFEDALDGWDMALASVKELAEKLDKS
ncbi:MAG TPA: SRPBCC domain-containing protein [Saprospiraceae bacterium]|nr:SRPBCC domain-containing protein [Saprospiraceae bacterium]